MKICVVALLLLFISDALGVDLKCKPSQEVKIEHINDYNRLAILPNYLFFDNRAIIKPDLKRETITIYSSSDTLNLGFTEVLFVKDSSYTRSNLETESSLNSKVVCDDVKFELRSDSKENIYLIAENKDYFILHLTKEHSSWQDIFSNYVDLQSK